MAKAQGDIRYLQGVFDSTSQEFLGISDPNTSGDGVDFSVPVYSDAQIEAGATGVVGESADGKSIGTDGIEYWPAKVSKDQSGNVTAILNGDASVSYLGKTKVVTVAPYKLGFYGDSRDNSGSTGPDVSDYQLFTNLRMPTFVQAYLGDAEIVRNYGVSGDAVVNWNVSNRTGGKTFIDMDNSDLDVVVIQYGVNDAMAGTPAATIVSASKALISEIIKSGKYVVYEAINPIRAPATNPVTTQATIDSVNSQMKVWIENTFPYKARFANTAPLLKSPDGFANPELYHPDGIHFIQPGAIISGKGVMDEVRQLLPKRPFMFIGQDSAAPNLINLLSPTTFIVAENATISGQSTTTGQDENGFYTEFVWTPATLVSGECRVRLEFSANFQTANQPAYALAGNEILQGSARVICDNGSGGAPNAYSVGMRQRFYTASLFRDWGIIPAGTPFPDFTEKFDLQLTTPKMVNTAASVVADPSSASGYQLQIFVSSQTIGVPVRTRVYNAQLRRVGYRTTPMAQSVPASGSPYINTTNGNQQVYVSGGTVSSIAVNGVATGLTSGTFTLSPYDTLTPTYTVAPTTFTSKNF